MDEIMNHEMKLVFENDYNINQQLNNINNQLNTMEPATKKEKGYCENWFIANVALNCLQNFQRAWNECESHTSYSQAEYMRMAFATIPDMLDLF